MQVATITLSVTAYATGNFAQEFFRPNAASTIKFHRCGITLVDTRAIVVPHYGLQLHLLPEPLRAIFLFAQQAGGLLGYPPH